jgi:hypothetical protein
VEIKFYKPTKELSIEKFILLRTVQMGIEK